MKEKVHMIARLLLGLLFLVFGLNGFLQFLPMPEMNMAASSFMGALYKTGYMLPLIKFVEVVCGALLLSGLYVPLAVVLIAPIVVNIVLFHFLLDPSGLMMAVLILIMWVMVFLEHKHYYNPLFMPKP